MGLGEDWIFLAQDREKSLDVVKTVMNLGVPYSMVDILTS